MYLYGSSARSYKSPISHANCLVHISKQEAFASIYVCGKVRSTGHSDAYTLSYIATKRIPALSSLNRQREKNIFTVADISEIRCADLTKECLHNFLAVLYCSKMFDGFRMWGTKILISYLNTNWVDLIWLICFFPLSLERGNRIRQ